MNLHRQEHSEATQAQRHLSNRKENYYGSNSKSNLCPYLPSKIVLDLIRNQPADKAMAILQYTPKAACEPVMKVLKSAIANAENNNNMDTSRLVVSYCNATAGPTLKRIQA